DSSFRHTDPQIGREDILDFIRSVASATDKVYLFTNKMDEADEDKLISRTLNYIDLDNGNIGRAAISYQATASESGDLKWINAIVKSNREIAHGQVVGLGEENKTFVPVWRPDHEGENKYFWVDAETGLPPLGPIVLEDLTGREWYINSHEAIKEKQGLMGYIFDGWAGEGKRLWMHQKILDWTGADWEWANMFDATNFSPSGAASIVPIGYSIKGAWTFGRVGLKVGLQTAAKSTLRTALRSGLSQGWKAGKAAGLYYFNSMASWAAISGAAYGGITWQQGADFDTYEFVKGMKEDAQLGGIMTGGVVLAGKVAQLERVQNIMGKMQKMGRMANGLPTNTLLQVGMSGAMGGSWNLARVMYFAKTLDGDNILLGDESDGLFGSKFFASDTYLNNHWGEALTQFSIGFLVGGLAGYGRMRFANRPGQYKINAEGVKELTGYARIIASGAPLATEGSRGLYTLYTMAHYTAVTAASGQLARWVLPSSDKMRNGNLLGDMIFGAVGGFGAAVGPRALYNTIGDKTKTIEVIENMAKEAAEAPGLIRATADAFKTGSTLTSKKLFRNAITFPTAGAAANVYWNQNPDRSLSQVGVDALIGAGIGFGFHSIRSLLHGMRSAKSLRMVNLISLSMRPEMIPWLSIQGALDFAIVMPSFSLGEALLAGTFDDHVEFSRRGLTDAMRLKMQQNYQTVGENGELLSRFQIEGKGKGRLREKQYGLMPSLMIQALEGAK
ncbi:MAG: hypothetical protein KC713_09545, partial [Candidatus Omnitrophica bacterium]|nr:hypothetical protein [Candidatus Omnitrophota bacterium]